MFSSVFIHGQVMTQVLLSTAKIQTLTRQRSRILLAALAAGLVGIFAYLAGISFLLNLFQDAAARQQSRPQNPLPFLAFLPAPAIVIAMLSWAERKASRYAITCPNCQADVTRFTQRILATRCCHHCEQQMVEGRRTRGIQTFRRFTRIQQRKFLMYWLWVWPIIAMAFFTLSHFDTTILQRCPQMLIVPGILGTVSAGWSFARTQDWRYFPQMIASGFVLVWGWRLIW